MKKVAAGALLLALSGCAYQPSYSPDEANKAMKPEASEKKKAEAKKELPAEVSNFLNQTVNKEQEDGLALLEEPRFVLQADDVDAKAFFYGLAADSPYNILVHPNVSGEISLSLKDVTLDETLDAVQDMYGFEVRRAGRTIQIYPAGVRTQTFSLDYLSLRRFGVSQTEISGGGVSEERNQGSRNNSGSRNSNTRSEGTPLLGNNDGEYRRESEQNQLQGNGSSINTQSETDLWGGLKDVIEGIIGGGNVVLSPQAGIVSVTASPSKLRAVGDFISVLESRLQRQVILEARIIEVTLNDGYQQGINWSDLYNGKAGWGVGVGVGFDGTDPLPAASTIGGLFGLTYSDESNNFSGMIEMLQTQGTVQVLSNPRVSASNNQKAVIKIGEDSYYVTNVDSTTNFGGGNSGAVSSSNVDLTPFFSGISLDVTPQISDDGEVILHVHPSVVETEEQQKVITLTEGELVLPLARSNIRESDTIVKARNGEIVVLGGLMQTTNSEEVGKVPLLGDIPLLGELFTNRRNRQEKKELVILLKPTVVGVDTWRDELKRSRELLQEWFPDIEQ
ncbi:MAG: pilus (MSHA type) biogenesis protein MshL [Idiomarinaceae bacterium]|uniref:pilus (MSHA type) biogenesis protein MshL n=1 Tax=Idiomarina sp. 28-8 TaxID=1260624 RepID=UPI0002F9E596|nr:pilus (MSHA type) biogenesis protein MshL [Idiomarina sp. 28-8]NWO01734.1 pilus (MSHA type) biogenesis protein MshL [Idiomarinaceae bacterium]